nr:Helix-turn-helix domain protein [Virgibacillus halodenitrificans]
MLAKKAYKFRIYPTKKQMELINKTIGCSRFVYNYFVGKQKSKDAYWHIANEMVQNGQLTENNWKGRKVSKSSACAFKAKSWFFELEKTKNKSGSTSRKDSKC